MATLEPESGASVPVPMLLTSLVGREREIEQVGTLLRRPGAPAGSRLLTLTGPGGVGKTRLALAAAAMAGDFADGVRFVPLAALQDHRLVASSLVQALGLRELGARPFVEQVQAAREFEALLLVDNF